MGQTCHTRDVVTPRLSLDLHERWLCEAANDLHRCTDDLDIEMTVHKHRLLIIAR
jgi:hypothetical protein